MQSTEEVWRPIPGHDGYEASSTGRLRSVSREMTTKRGVKKPVKGRILTLHGNAKDGYLRTFLGKGSQSTVHRYVCMAFHGLPPFEGAVVRHLNDMKQDNRAENLRWGTRADNSRDSIRNGTWANQNSKVTHCKYGHELTGENLYIRPNGNRTCRECERRKQAVYRDRNRAAVRKRGREFAAKKRAEKKRETDDLGWTNRGANGFGSSGVK